MFGTGLLSGSLTKGGTVEEQVFECCRGLMSLLVSLEDLGHGFRRTGGGRKGKVCPRVKS